MSNRKNAKEAPKKPVESRVINIKRPNLQTVEFEIYGESPLICHKWSDKAKKEMLDKQMGVETGPREPKNPEEEYKASLYVLSDGGYGFPAVGFKNAAVRAAKGMGIAMTDARGMFRVRADEDDLVRIKGAPSMREDMVRLPTGSADLRYRGEFREWTATLTVTYNANLITEAQLLSIFESAGFSVGIGEWRNEKDGDFGCFTLIKGGK